MASGASAGLADNDDEAAEADTMATSGITTGTDGFDDDEDAPVSAVEMAEARADVIRCRSLSAAEAPKYSSVPADFLIAAAINRSLQRRESPTPLKRACSARCSAAEAILSLVAFGFFVTASRRLLPLLGPAHHGRQNSSPQLSQTGWLEARFAP